MVSDDSFYWSKQLVSSCFMDGLERVLSLRVTRRNRGRRARGSMYVVDMSVDGVAGNEMWEDSEDEQDHSGGHDPSA